MDTVNIAMVKSMMKAFINNGNNKEALVVYNTFKWFHDDIFFHIH